MAELSLKKYEFSKGAKGATWACIFVGVIVFLLGLKGDAERTWHAYLMSYFYFLSLGLGGVFFAAINHVTSAGWSVSIRRIAEAFSAFVPIAMILTIPLLFGTEDLFKWFNAEYAANDYLISKKTAYLNPTFFYIRLVTFFAIWIFFAHKLRKNSLDQDKDGDPSKTSSNLTYSVLFLLAFALSYSLFSVDWMMSLEAHWFSTMFGVYTFAGLFQSVLAMLALFIIYLIKKGTLQGFVSQDHLHDVAKYMWAFTIFYAYIAFSQFMLIWYTNLPEETLFFMMRIKGDWFWVSMALIIFKFIVPFLALAPRAAKRNFAHVRNVAILILLTQVLDNFWLVYPNLSTDKVIFGYIEIGLFLGFLGAFLLVVHTFLAKHNVVAIKDPRLEEALHHHV
tara:strand:+ start:7657 stop:8835 length:1179 start_codon:yes stop_codon:yes gene_type:complete